jgi:hypothetical protein
MILHGFWLSIALLAYPGQILVTCVYIVPTLVIITIVWDIILEMIDSSMTLIHYLWRKKCRICCHCNNSTNKDCCKISIYKSFYFASLICDLIVLTIVLGLVVTFWSLLIYIVYEFIQFIHLHVELNVGIFGSLIAVLPLIAFKLLLISFFIIASGLFKRKANVKPYPFTAPFIYKLIKFNVPLTFIRDLYKSMIFNIKNHFTRILRDNYSQESILLKLQCAVQITVKEKIDAYLISLEERNNTSSNEHNTSEDNILEIKNEIIHAAIEIIFTTNSESRANTQVVPLEMIIIEVHNGIQQAIEKAIQNGSRSAQTPVLTSLYNNQKALQDAIKVIINDNDHDCHVDIENIETIISSHHSASS